MNTEFVVDINGTPTDMYMRGGFFDHEDMEFPLHEHALPEIHILLGGTAILECDKKDVLLVEGDALCLPARVPHAYRSFEKGAKRMTFFVNCDALCVIAEKTFVPKPLLRLLCKEIEDYVLTGKDNKLKPLLSYICTDFFGTKGNKSTVPTANRQLLIDEFFRERYNTNVTLDDLADKLMLSRKQTEREVERVTGNTFTAELAKRRIRAAIILSQTTDLPLTKISELVGYSSYSGFYKAYKRVLSNSRGNT